jgi:hypothetical protein
MHAPSRFALSLWTGRWLALTCSRWLVFLCSQCCASALLGSCLLLLGIISAAAAMQLAVNLLPSYIDCMPADMHASQACIWYQMTALGELRSAHTKHLVRTALFQCQWFCRCGSGAGVAYEEGWAAGHNRLAESAAALAGVLGRMKQRGVLVCCGMQAGRTQLAVCAVLVDEHAALRRCTVLCRWVLCWFEDGTVRSMLVASVYGERCTSVLTAAAGGCLGSQ